MRPSNSQRVDIAIITGSRDELEPVLNLLGGRDHWEPFELHEFRHYSGQFRDGARTLNVVAGSLWNTTGITAGLEVYRLQELDPRLVVMTGTCVGWQEQGIQLGDLLVADRAFSGGQGKLSEAGLQADIQTYQSPAWLIQRLKDFVYDLSWATSLTIPRPLSLRYQVDWLLCQRFKNEAFPSAQADWDQLKTLGIEYSRVKQWLQAEKLLTKAGKLTRKAHRRLDELREQRYGELDPEPDPQPAVHYTAFASLAADIAVETPFVDLSKHVRSLGAIDKETAAFFTAAFEVRADAFAVKGVARYATPDSDNRFQAYAAEASARWMHAFVCQMALQIAATDARAAQAGVFVVDEPQVQYYIEREDVITAVRSLLIPDSSIATPSDDDRRLVAIHGMPGVGKTVLARALCDDPEVRRAFPDGVLWITLGQKPDLLPGLRLWVEKLGGRISENAPTRESLRSQLAELIKEKQCLLVADDVWAKRDIEELLISGPDCCVLATTRNAALMKDLGAQIYPINVMNPSEATTLLEKWSRGRLASVDQIVKDDIIRKLGSLPLAIRLAGVQLQYAAPEEWLRSFDVRMLNAFEQEQAHDSLVATFGLSLDALDSYDARIARPYRTRQLYTALGIFKEDERIPEAAIAQLWKGLHGLDRNATRSLIDYLAERALLTMTLEATPTGMMRLVTLHDLLRDTLIEELGERHIATHQALLDTYRKTQQGTGWHTAPDDGYLYDHLAYHLDAVEAAAELKDLFADQGWMNARVAQSGYTYDGYLADLDRAWKHADTDAKRQIDAGQEPIAFAGCVRYALLRTSITSIAANYQPELVGRAVETGLWTPRRALSVAAQAKSLYALKRVRMYVAILDTGKLNMDQREEAQRLGMKAALELKDGSAQWQPEALSALAPHLSGALLQQALEAALALEFGWRRAQVLAALAPHLTGALRQQALEAALALEPGGDRAWALTALAPHLTGDQHERAVQEALVEATRAITADSTGLVLAALAPHLTGLQRQQALEAVLLTGAYRDLAALAPHLTGLQRQEALAAALALAPGRQRALALAALAPHLTDSQRRQVLAADRPLVFASQQAPYLTGPLLEQRLAAALAIESDQKLAEALAALLPYMTPVQHEQALQHGLEAIHSLQKKDQREVPAVLVPHLTNTLLELELEACRSFSDEGQSVHALVTLALYLSDTQRERALQQGSEAARTLQNQEERVAVLAALTPHLTDAQRTGSINEGLQTIRIMWESQKAQAMDALAPHLTSNWHEQALEAAGYSNADEPDHAELARARLAVLGQMHVLAPYQIMWVLASAISDLSFNRYTGIGGGGGGRTLEIKLNLQPAPAHSVTGYLRGALADALALKDDEDRARALAALAPHLTGVMLEYGLRGALRLKDKRWRARAIVAFLPFAADQTQLLKSIRHALVSYVDEAKYQQRRSILSFCAIELLFTPPILAPATLSAIAEHIIEICQEWRWI